MQRIRDISMQPFFLSRKAVIALVVLGLCPRQSMMEVAVTSSVLVDNNIEESWTCFVYDVWFYMQKRTRCTV
jgi:hypothetical protein